MARAIRAGGARAFFEVVSLDRDSELASAAAAADFGVDWLLGGVRASEVAPIAASAGIRYAPFPGAIVGHPSALVGAIEEIEASARALCAVEGVAGLDLLAYRHAGDVPALIRAVVGAVDKPVIVAGSIDDADAHRRGRGERRGGLHHRLGGDRGRLPGARARLRRADPRDPAGGRRPRLIGRRGAASAARFALTGCRTARRRRSCRNI